MAIKLKTVWNSPQAIDDTYWWTEDELLALNYLNAGVLTLDVMVNDLGGSGKTLYSIDDGNGNFLQDMLDNDVTTGWENTASGNQIRIINGIIEFDLTHDLSLIGGSIDGLSAGESLYDSFTYSIQLGNGTLSWANVSVRIDGLNDGPVAVADTDAADEDTTITGSVATNDGDPDHDAVLTYSLDTAVAGLTLNADGSYSFDAGDAAYQYLAAGEQLDVVADYTVTDEWGASSSSTLTITITGEDDAPAAPSFRPAYTVGVGTFVAVGDVNGDGKPDLVTEANLANIVTVAFGNGNGTFAPATIYPVGDLPNAVELADLNNDGKLDIVVANGNSNSTGVLLNNGDGTYATEVAYATGPHPTGLALGDLNDDGIIDIVTTNQLASTVSVLLGNGNGTFASQMQFNVELGPVFVVIADVNVDGDADLVVGNNHAGLVSVLLGDGSGTFATHTDYSAPGPIGMAVGDLNGDAKPDIVGSNQHGGSNDIWVLLNNGDGSYGATTHIAQSDSLGVGLYDLNTDGDLDLILGTYSTGSVDVRMGNGDGTFDAPTSFAAPGAGFFEIADLNADGLVDIAVTTSSSTVSVLLQDFSLI